MQGASAILALTGASAIATLANTAISTSSTTGALQVAGGAYFGANSLFNANLTMQGASAILALTGASAIATFANTTISTSSTTGTIRNLGGLFTKNMWLGGVAFVTQAVSTTGPLLNIAATTITANNTSDMAFVSVQQPTLANSTISSVTANAATVYIADAPIAGTNQTITNPLALNVAAGKVRFSGAFQLTTGAANNYLLTSDASGNATWSASEGVVSLADFNAISTTSFSTNSITATNVTTMTLTPTVAGTYWITYTSNFRVANSSTTSTFDLALNGTTITNTINIFSQTQQTNTYTVVTNVFQAFNGTTDTITARVKVNSTSTSVTIAYRSMLALRVSA